MGRVSRARDQVMAIAWEELEKNFGLVQILAFSGNTTNWVQVRISTFTCIF